MESLRKTATRNLGGEQMEHDEFILNASEIVPDRPCDSSRERTCAECGRQFFVSNMDLWVYRTTVNGRIQWFCRYNCHRAGGKKIEAEMAKSRVRKGRTKELRSKKPSEDELETDLRAGRPIAIIAKIYGSSVQSVHNWIKSYGLAGIQGVKKPNGEDKPATEITSEVAKAEKFYADLKQAYIDDAVQTHSSKAEIEQFNADIPVQELTEEIVPSGHGIDVSKVESFFVDTPVEELIVPKVGFAEPIHIPVESAEESEEKAWRAKEVELRRINWLRSRSIVEDELMKDDDEPLIGNDGDEPAPRETFDEIWQDVHDDLATLRRLYVAQAKKSFRKRLVDLTYAVSRHGDTESLLKGGEKTNE